MWYTRARPVAECVSWLVNVVDSKFNGIFWVSHSRILGLLSPFLFGILICFARNLGEDRRFLCGPNKFLERSFSYNLQVDGRRAKEKNNIKATAATDLISEFPDR